METMIKTEFWNHPGIEKFTEFLDFEFNSKSELKQHLKNYKWPERGVKKLCFEETYNKINCWRTELYKSLTEKEDTTTFEICKEILHWGGVTKNNLTKIEDLKNRNQLISTLSSVRQLIKMNNINISDEKIYCSSGFSKIYTCLYDRFIIYDSRVAAAMCFLIKKCFKNEIPEIIRLGKTDFQKSKKNITNRDPGKEFRMISGNDKKYLESNIKASWIIEKLTEQNPKPDFKPEKLIFAYQTALFVLGKDLNKLNN